MSRFVLVNGVDGEQNAFGGIIDIEQDSQDPFYLELIHAIGNTNREISYECQQETFEFYTSMPFTGTIESEAIIYVEE